MGGRGDAGKEDAETEMSYVGTSATSDVRYTFYVLCSTFYVENKS